MTAAVQAFLLLLLLLETATLVRGGSGRTKEEIRGFLDKDNLPDTGREWISLSEGLEFQPAADLILNGNKDRSSGVKSGGDVLDDKQRSQLLRDAAVHRWLVGNSGSYSGYENQFADGSGTYYNDYAQAWRLLGFYIDCNSPHNNFNECNENGEGGGGGNDNKDNNEVACQRYLMWAAVSTQYTTKT